jgi:hypothetical protein
MRLSSAVTHTPTKKGLQANYLEGGSLRCSVVTTRATATCGYVIRRSCPANRRLSPDSVNATANIALFDPSSH